MSNVYIQSDALSFILMSAEVCDPYHAILSDLVPQGTIVSGYLDHVFGYLPSNTQAREGGYEGGGYFYNFTLEGELHKELQAPVRKSIEQLALVT
jgi:hypothetical protein